MDRRKIVMIISPPHKNRFKKLILFKKHSIWL